MIKYFVGIVVLIGLVWGIYIYLVPKQPVDYAYEPEIGLACHETDSHLIVVRDREGAVGQDMLIKKKSSPQEVIPCAYSVADGDRELSNTEPDYLLGATGKFLLIDSGTAPPPRELAIIDMNSGERVYSDRYNRPAEIVDGALTYWQPTDTAPTKENCPELPQLENNGLGAGIERHVSLDLASLVLTDLDETRCSARQ